MGEHEGKKKVTEVKTFAIPFPLKINQWNLTFNTNTSSKYSKEQIINQAFQLHSQGNISEAAKCYQYCINQGFNDYQVFSNYGIILKGLGKLKEAELSTRKAIELKPDYANAHYNLGIIYNLKGQYNQASNSFRKSLSLDSDRHPARYHLGVSLENEAKSQYRKGLEKSGIFLENEAKSQYLQAFEKSDVKAKIGLENRKLSSYTKKNIIINQNIIVLLNQLSKSINSLYGSTPYGGHAINSGPCGVFAHEFFILWNSRFINQVEIGFRMLLQPYQCNHVFIILPNNRLYDGGIGVHDFNNYKGKDTELIFMKKYDLEVLDQHSFGLIRSYGQSCPNFSINKTTEVITKYLNEIYYTLS